MDNKPQEIGQQNTRPTPLQLLSVDTAEAIESLRAGRLTPHALANYIQMSFVRGSQDCLNQMIAREKADTERAAALHSEGGQQDAAEKTN